VQLKSSANLSGHSQGEGDGFLSSVDFCRVAYCQKRVPHSSPRASSFSLIVRTGNGYVRRPMKNEALKGVDYRRSVVIYTRRTSMDGVSWCSSEGPSPRDRTKVETHVDVNRVEMSRSTSIESLSGCRTYRYHLGAWQASHRRFGERLNIRLVYSDVPRWL